MTLEELMIQISVVTNGSDEALAELQEKIRQYAQDSQNTTKRSAAEQAAAWTAISAAATAAFAKIVAAVEQGIEASNRYTAALRGLESVSTSKGIADASMKQSLGEVTDAFFDTTAAATAYKNLLSRGFSLDQATATIKRLKDAAAYGRQANLSLKDAVVSATEGLKNENSILVDNAGVTKNVSTMWKEYAESIGVGVQSLTQAQKIEAEYHGILRETTAQVGDLQKLSEGLSGTQAEAAMQGEQAYRALGEAMTPMVDTGTQGFTAILKGVTDVTTACPELTAGLTSAAGAMMLLIAAKTGLAVIQTLMSSIGLSASALGPLAIAAAAFGLLAMGYTAIANAAEEAKKREQERIAANKEAVANEQTRLRRLDELTARYKELSGKTRLTYDNQRELEGIQQELADAYGISAKGVDGLKKSTEEYTAALRLSRLEQLKEMQSKQKQASQDAYVAANGKEASDSLREVLKLKEDIARNEDILKNPKWGSLEITGAENALRDYTDLRGVVHTGLRTQLAEAEKALAEYNSLYADWYKAAMDEMSTAVQTGGGAWNDTLASALNAMFTDSFNLTNFDSTSAANAFVDSCVLAVKDACSNADISSALESMAQIKQKALDGVALTEDDQTAITEAWAMLSGEDSPIMTALAAMGEATGLSGEALHAWQLKMLDTITPLSLLGSNAQGVVDSLNNSATALDDTAAEMAEVKKRADDLAPALTKLEKTIDNNKTVKKYVDQWKDLKKAFDETKKKGGDTSDVLSRMSTLCKQADVAFDGMEGGVDAAGCAFTLLGDNVDATKAQIANDIQELETELATLQAKMTIYGYLGLDTTDLQSKIADAMDRLNKLIALAVANGVKLKSSDTARRRGGGGGGGGGASNASVAADTESAYEKAIATMEHLKATSEMTYEAELKYLKRIRKQVQMTAQEKLDLAERVYAVQRSIAERDAQNLDDLASALQTALAERYRAMEDAELETIENSRKNWEEWREASVSAVQAQIDALDELTQSEDREAAKAEALRKIAKLRESMQYEQDAYNRAKIQQQLEAATTAYEKLLTKYDREEQKDKLREQIDAINGEADAALDALDKQQEKIEALYAERLKAASLQAESEKLLMESTQEDIIQLISDYAPDYNATGKTLGERMLAGFKEKFGEIEKWIASVNERIAEAQRKAAELAQQAADDFYAGASQQQASAKSMSMQSTVNIYQPVETPSETARRVAQANEALAEELLRAQ